MLYCYYTVPDGLAVCHCFLMQSVIHPSRWSEERLKKHMPLPSQKELLALGGAAWTLLGTHVVLLHQQPVLPAPGVSRVIAKGATPAAFVKTACDMRLNQAIIAGRSGLPKSTTKPYSVSKANVVLFCTPLQLSHYSCFTLAHVCTSTLQRAHGLCGSIPYVALESHAFGSV
jgi:hypothetical protein